jgi:hypothetical protein
MSRVLALDDNGIEYVEVFNGPFQYPFALLAGGVDGVAGEYICIVEEVCLDGVLFDPDLLIAACDCFYFIFLGDFAFVVVQFYLLLFDHLED